MTTAVHEIDSDGVSLGGVKPGARTWCGFKGTLETAELGGPRYLKTWRFDGTVIWLQLPRLKAIADGARGVLNGTHLVAIDSTTCRNCLRRRKQRSDLV